MIGFSCSSVDLYGLTVQPRVSGFFFFFFLKRKSWSKARSSKHKLQGCICARIEFHAPRIFILAVDRNPAPPSHRKSKSSLFLGESVQFFFLSAREKCVAPNIVIIDCKENQNNFFLHHKILSLHKCIANLTANLDG